MEQGFEKESSWTLAKCKQKRGVHAYNDKKPQTNRNEPLVFVLSEPLAIKSWATGNRTLEPLHS